jgi:hypothetical protein
MFCPTIEQTLDAVLKLLPRGRAWQTNEGLPKSPSILWQFWRAYADVAQFFVDTICALRLEFWCSTHSQTHPEWLIEYGLPDACDPFPDLCTKVAAIGGTRCEYYQEIAARMGWSIICEDARVSCGSRAGCSRAGVARTGSTQNHAALRIVVLIDESEALDQNYRKVPRAGRMRSGTQSGCGPNFSDLKCILTRVIHAEILTIYEGR